MADRASSFCKYVVISSYLLVSFGRGLSPVDVKCKPRIPPYRIESMDEEIHDLLCPKDT